MGKRIVIALGGNALGKTLREQMAAVRPAARIIVDLIEDGHEIILTHGNGPQVGMIQNAFTAARNAGVTSDHVPLTVCTAMSQGYIGYDLQNALTAEMAARGIKKVAATVLTQVTVDRSDPAYRHPSKPIGPFMTEEQAKTFAAETGAVVAEDAGRGWRQVVASPKPLDVIEIDAVRAMLEAGVVPVACGGGGISVEWESDGFLRGAGAVIDKDFASEKLAELLDADLFIILTAVEHVSLFFGTEKEQKLSVLTAKDAEKYIKEGHFPAGSMLPKVEAAVAFAKSKPGREALITLLEKAREGIAGRTGTRVVA